MGSMNNLVRGLMIAAVLILATGQWYLSQYGTSQKHSVADAWNFHPDLNGSVGKVKTENRQLDLSDRDVVLNRRTVLEGQGADDAGASGDKMADVETQEKEKANKKKKKKKKVAKKKKKNSKETDPSAESEEKDIADAEEDKANASPTAQRRAPKVGSPAAGPLAEAQPWRMLLFPTPNANAVSEFIQSYSSGDISKDTFYTLVEEMLLYSPRESYQNLALQALTATPSYESFRLIALYESLVEPSLQSKFASSLEAYAERSHVGVLEQALSSGDQDVAYYAAVLLEGVANSLVEKAKQQSDDPRHVRGLSHVDEASDYRRFIPILSELVNSADQSLAQAASNALSQLSRVVQS